ncbi:DUF6792 domain-containing protein [Candidatus Margulisiibacteriota bacterium]
MYIDGKSVYKNEATGYVGVLVQKKTTNGQPGQLVLVHRGTDFLTAEDWSNNFGLIGGHEGQIADAKAFYERVRAAYPDQQIIQAGHSLGGGIAQALTVWNRKIEPNNNDFAVTFNPAGSWPVINRWDLEYPNYNLNPDDNYNYIDNYIVNTDVVPALLPQIGNLIYVESPLSTTELKFLKNKILCEVSGTPIMKGVIFTADELRSHGRKQFHEGGGYQETQQKMMYNTRVPMWP